jgi:hypothetical protein
MRGRIIVSAALACLFAPSGLSAQPLKVVEVSAPAINCVFKADCNPSVTDTSENIRLPTLNAGDAWLQSRTFTGEAGTPAGAGITGYEYRISLTQGAGATDCVASFALNFGPHKPLAFRGATLADVYVVTIGGLGTIGLASATRFGDVIEFALASPVCVDGPANAKNTTFFIGLAAKAAPMRVTAHVAVTGATPIYAVDARVPTHRVRKSPPGGL